jgi:hypothetical protein
VTDPNIPADDDERVQAFLDAYRDDDDSELVAQVRAYVYLTIGDLRGILAERDRLTSANETTPSTAAAWEVDSYATRYTAYSTGAADEAPGWLPVDAMHAVVAELAAAHARIAEMEAECADIGNAHRELLARTYCALCGNRRTSAVHITGCLTTEGA